MVTVGFSINLNDKDGDSFDNCILLHFNDTFILKLSDLDDLNSLITQLKNIEDEIIETTE